MSPVPPAEKPLTVERFNEASIGNHHGWLGFDVTEIGLGHVRALMEVRTDHLNPGSGLHGGVSASLADSLCGYGVFTALAEGAVGFTTVGLHASYLGRAAVGDVIDATARLVRGGRQLQVWNVDVGTAERQVATISVTQLLRYDR